ncbi:MAG: hypothetical protein QOF48_766 [Verrucomicrobiota bacterium]|jgi:hypothetical protein
MVAQLPSALTSEKHVSIQAAFRPGKNILAAKLARMQEGRQIALRDVFELLWLASVTFSKVDAGKNHGTSVLDKRPTLSDPARETRRLEQ